MPFLSIAIPLYNSEQYIRRCVDSILLQDYLDYELILVDDGSNDNSAKILQEYVNRDSRIKYVKQKNSGVSAARNYALSIARGTYIYFLDSDDYIESGLFSSVVSLIKKYRNPDLILFGYRMISEKRSKVISKKPISTIYLSKKQFIHNFVSIEKSIDINSVWNKFYKLEIIQKSKLSFTKRKVGEDAIFNYHYYYLVNSICMLDKIYYNYTFERSDSAMNEYNNNRIWEKFDVINEYEKMCEYLGVTQKSPTVNKKVNIIYYEYRNIINRRNESKLKKIYEYKTFEKKLKKDNLLRTRDLFTIRDPKIILKFFLIKYQLMFLKILIVG